MGSSSREQVSGFAADGSSNSRFQSASTAGFGHPAPTCVTTTTWLGTPLGARRAASLPSRDGLDMAPQPLAGAARSQADLRLDAVVEFLEVAIHHTLHARGVYPRELFEARSFYGARVQRCRHPDLTSYVDDAVSALRGPIARGDVQRVVLVIKDGDSGGAGAPLERHVFDFVLHPSFLADKPTKEDVDALVRCFAGCVTKIAYLDATVPPLPSGAIAGCTFEIVAYAKRPGVSDDLGADAWSEQRVESLGDGDGAEGTEPATASEGDGAERRMEFPRRAERETFPVKSTTTNLVNLDVYVERRKT